MSKWRDAKKSAAARDDGKCRRCHKVAVDVHHRKPKGMGGTSDPETNYSMANLVCLCRSCHDHIHANPAESYGQGWLVRMGENPAEVPIQGRSVWEGSTGSNSPQERRF